MAFRTKLRFAILAAAAGSALIFSACGSDDNPTPAEPGAGGKGSGGKGSGGSSSGGKGSGGGKVSPDSGSGGDENSGGSSGSGSGGTASGGAENTGGVVIIVPDAGCEENGCWKCPQKAEPKHFLNACTDSNCVHYDNSALSGTLPPLP